MDKPKFQFYGIFVGSAIFFIVLFFFVSLGTGYEPYAEHASTFSVLKTVFGWLALFAFASVVIVYLGRMSQLITSGWFLGILIGAIVVVSISAAFLFTAAGPRTTTVEGVAIRSVKQLNEFASGGATKQEVTGEAAQYKATFDKRCSSCHTIKSIENALSGKYAAKNNVAFVVKWMAGMPNSPVQQSEVDGIIMYINALYGVGEEKSEAPAETAVADAGGADATTVEESTEEAPAEEGVETAEAEVSFDKEAILAEVNEFDTIEGEGIYKQSCAMCHDSGLSGAPKTGTASDWGTRMPQGVKKMTEKSIQGFNMMPARGGNSALTDEQVGHAVAFMVEESL